MSSTREDVDTHLDLRVGGKEKNRNDANDPYVSGDLESMFGNSFQGEEKKTEIGNGDTDRMEDDSLFPEDPFANVGGDSNGSRSKIHDEIRELEEDLGISTAFDRIAMLEEKMNSFSRLEKEETSNSGPSTNKDYIHQVKMIPRNMHARLQDGEKEEENDDEKFPLDCYSIVALNGPTTKGWPIDKISFFLFGLMVFYFQVAFLFLLIWSRIDANTGDMESDNPDEGFFQFVPTGSKQLIRASQFISLLAYAVFPDASLLEMVRAAQYFPRSSTCKSDPVGFMRLSCLLRGFQGCMATLAVLLVVITSNTVLDIILNFTALNFISSLDDEAFSLAQSGMFGESLRKETKRIEEVKLPECAKARSKVLVHWSVTGSTAMTLFAALIAVISFQCSTDTWITESFRIGLRDGANLDDYNGCYFINEDHYISERRTYSSRSGITNASFGYCESESRWVLFEGSAEGADPCDDNTEIAHSVETSDFDIAGSFGETWFYPETKIPIDLYFVDDSKGEKDLYCDMVVGDGICNLPFNKAGFQYDNGDCCAATCEQSKCGSELTNAFDTSDISGIGFPECNDPQMYPVTIQLNEIKSSRDKQFTDYEPCVKEQLEGGEPEWRGKTPKSPILSLECNGNRILSLSIEKAMENKNETVMVEDGASCRLAIENHAHVLLPDTQSAKNWRTFNLFCVDPIWYVNYTLFHGEDQPSKILTQHTLEKEYVEFQRIPECYVDYLKNHAHISSLYDDSSPSSKAIDWLRNNGTGHLECENDHFLERFSLAALIFAMNGTLHTCSTNECHCGWPGISCNAFGKVVKVESPKKSLLGSIPGEIKLLTSLEELFLYENQITSFPSEIGSMGNLRRLLFQFNQISSFPTEILQLSNLEILALASNGIASIPSQIGCMSNLIDVNLGNNSLTVIPSEIGLMKNLETATFESNQIASIPTEIGSMENLKTIFLGNNTFEFIPREIGLLKNLEHLFLGSNKITSIPREIGLLQSLKLIEVSQSIIASIPSEIGMLGSLEAFWLGDNNISSIPSEIGSLQNMQSIDLHGNTITSIPTEIGLLKNLQNLALQHNNVVAIPSETGLLESLQVLSLHNNTIAAIPSEIGLLTNLKGFFTSWNHMTSIPSEIGLMTSLNQYFFYANPISEIPTEIGLLSNLEYLAGGKGPISVIPSEIGLMTSLKKIGFMESEIKVIPSEIGLLTNLESLNFTDNKITTLPSEIGLLKNLKELILYQNNVTVIPTEIQSIPDITIWRQSTPPFVSPELPTLS